MASQIPESLREDIHQTEGDFRKLFAERFNAALDRHGHIPQVYGRGQAVSALFGITRATAGKWLNGEGLPELWRLPHLARLLNVDVNELVGGTTSPMMIDDRYVSLDIHEQDAPTDVVSIFLQPSTLKRIGFAPGCLLMRLSTNEMVGFAGIGDVVVYNPGVKWISTGTDVYVLRVKGRYVLRRATRTLRDEVVLSCENSLSQESFKGEDFTSEPAAHDPNLIYVVGQVMARIVLRGNS